MQKGRTVMIARLTVMLSLLAFAGCRGSSPPPTSSPEAQFGRFEGEVVAVWLEDGRLMQLTKDFAYLDPRGKRWLAPADAVIDGASIPQPFWSIIGGPFEGRFRNASVVHDAACDAMQEPWEAVHRMFYEACRCGGVGETQAKLMYWAVYRFGPRWRPVAEVRIEDGQPKTVMRVVRNIPQPPDEALVRKAKEYFATQNPSLEEIKTLKIEPQPP
jgi:hypothetical protein